VARESNNEIDSGLSEQIFRTRRGVIRQLTCGPFWPMRFGWASRASMTGRHDSIFAGFQSTSDLLMCLELTGCHLSVNLSADGAKPWVPLDEQVDHVLIERNHREARPVFRFE
jgi:hypothetical protein